LLSTADGTLFGRIRDAPNQRADRQREKESNAAFGQMLHIRQLVGEQLSCPTEICSLAGLSCCAAERAVARSRPVNG